MNVFPSCFLKRLALSIAAGLLVAVASAPVRAADLTDTETIDLTFTSIERIERYMDTNDTSDKKHMIYIGGTLDTGETAWVTFSACASCSNYLTLMEDCLRSGKLAKVLGDQGLHVYSTLENIAGIEEGSVELQEDPDGDGVFDLSYTISVAATTNEGFVSCGLVDP